LVIFEFSFLSSTSIKCAIVFSDNILIYVTSSNILNGLNIRTNKLLFQYKGIHIDSMLRLDEYYFIITNISGYITYWDIRNIGLYKYLDLVNSYDGVLALKNSIAIIKHRKIDLYSTVSDKLIKAINLDFLPKNTYFKLDNYSFILTDCYNDTMHHIDIKSSKVRAVGSSFMIQNICALRNKFIILKTGSLVKLLNYDFQLLDEKEYDVEAKSVICIMNSNTFITGDLKLVIWEINKDNRLKVKETIHNSSLMNKGVSFLLKLDMSMFIIGNNKSIIIWDVKLGQCIRDLGICGFKSNCVPILKNDTIIYVDGNRIKFISLYDKKVVSKHYHGIKEILA
jgi:hypothetical protein